MYFLNGSVVPLCSRDKLCGRGVADKWLMTLAYGLPGVAQSGTSQPPLVAQPEPHHSLMRREGGCRSRSG